MTIVRGAHCSMQYSDNDEQQTHDARILFRRGYDYITGTEAGPASNLAKILAREAKETNFAFVKAPGGADVWIAVSKDFIDGRLTHHYEKIVDGVAGRYAGKGLLTAEGNSKKLQRHVGFGVCHHMTKGQTPNDPFYQDNIRITNEIRKWAHDAAQGKDIIFYGGDTNTNDAKLDVFHGGPLTTAADETGRHYNTGHGPIDVAASYDLDKSVTALSWKVFDDSEKFMFTDHFFCEVVWDVEAIAHPDEGR